MPLNKETLAGNQIAWTNEEEGVACYTTNYGQVSVDLQTGEFVDCCFGLGRNYGNTQMGIKIYDGEFQVYKDTFNTIYAELCSKNYPYPRNKPSFPALEVIQMLQKDDNDGVAAILVKKEIVKLMFYHLKLNKSELIAIRELFKIWRKPIISRTPIIHRVPIIGGENK